MHRLFAISDDIYQVRIPLPFALSSVNCYLLRGEEGWSVVDTGLNTRVAQSVWRATFDDLAIGPRDIDQIVLTHVHPDHYGLSGWLQRVWQDDKAACLPPVRLSAREAEIVDSFWATDDDWESVVRGFWLSCGVPEIMAEEMVSSTGQTRRRVVPHPSSKREISVSDQLKMGDRWFQVIHTPGHSDGHLVFYDKEDQLMLCGDHVLVKITSNIGLWPHSEPDPLGRYLGSLDELARLPVRLALPGHGPLITDFVGRISELQQHHAERLALTAKAAGDGSTVYQASQHIFSFHQLSVHEKRFAVAETLAHLEYLVKRKVLCQEGVDLWQSRLA